MIEHQETRSIVASGGFENLSEQTRSILAFHLIESLNNAFLTFVLQQDDVFIARFLLRKNKNIVHICRFFSYELHVVCICFSPGMMPPTTPKSAFF